MTIELSIVVPCYNEEGNIPELSSRLLRVFDERKLNGEIVLINDGSTDNTQHEITKAAAKDPRVIGVHHKINSGIEQAWISGVEKSKGQYVCLIDGDLQNLPEDTWRLYREILYSNADIVQGYRSSVGRLRDSRFILSKGLNFLLNTLFSMRLQDNKSGFVLAGRDTMRDILRHRYKYKYFQSLIMVAAATKGYHIREIETLFESRLAGESFMPRFPVLTVFWVIFDLIKAFYEFSFFVKKEDIVRDYLKKHKPRKEDPELPIWRRLLMGLFFNTMPLHKWLISRTAKYYYKELKRSQWLSTEDIRGLQLLKLRHLINHAYCHVAYYRHKMDQLGVKPSDIQSLDDLRKLPLLSKDDVRSNLYFDLLSDNHDKKKILRVNTSGSTGEPFTCFADRHQLEIRWASTLRSQEWTGYRFGDRQARLWHQTIGMSLTQIIREKIDALLCRRLFIPAFEISKKNVEQFVKKLVAYKPEFIDGYAESFNFLAEHLKSNSIDGLRPKAIMSSAQILPQQSRKIIEDKFKCGVFDKYGSREFSGIAYECSEHDGHHIIAESYIVEILKDGKPAKPGETGEVIITDLNNYCMPFIRYQIGDLAVAMDNSVECKCGRALPKIGTIAGRVQAIILGANGTYLPGTFFAHLFKDYDYLVKQYQIIQAEEGKITLNIIKGPRYTENGFKEVLDLLKEYLGDDADMNIEFVDKIQMVRTGKHQGAISKLKIDFQEISKHSKPAEKVEPFH